LASLPERQGIVSISTLDNPVWHALTTQHAALAITATGAAKYPQAVAPFAAVDDEPGHAAMQLASLVEDSESVYLVGVAPDPPPGWILEPGKPCLQMICHAPPADIPGPPVTEMSEVQRDDMLALTALVFPGFFRPRTLEMGRYLGIYDGGRLAAMAGERMRLDGFQEISAVCTHPDYTGRGYAQRLVSLICRGAFERGFMPFLHVYHDNVRAIAVYRQLGFADRTSLPLWSLHKTNDH
jgi:ribosomal protein S18 acetylase RimI-like enzyme